MGCTPGIPGRACDQRHCCRIEKLPLAEWRHLPGGRRAGKSQGILRWNDASVNGRIIGNFCRPGDAVPIIPFNLSDYFHCDTFMMTGSDSRTLAQWLHPFIYGVYWFDFPSRNRVVNNPSFWWTLRIRFELTVR